MFVFNINTNINIAAPNTPLKTKRRKSQSFAAAVTTNIRQGAAPPRLHDKQPKKKKPKRRQRGASWEIKINSNGGFAGSQ